MTERNRSKAGDIFGTVVAGALLGGVVLPILALWAGISWNLFRWVT